MKHVINIFGPSTAGKSTIAELLVKQITDVAVVDFDVIKREIPGYHWQKHTELGRSMTLQVFKDVIGTHQTIILLMALPRNQEEYERIPTIASRNDYAIVNIELTAPDDVLIGRYETRMSNVDPAKKHWKFKTMDEFKAKLAENYFRPPGTITFDSSLTKPDAIVSSICETLNSL